MQPKKQLKVQYIGIFEEIGSFYWPKMHFLKKGQGQCPKENVFFPLRPSLSDNDTKHWITRATETWILIKDGLRWLYKLWIGCNIGWQQLCVGPIALTRDRHEAQTQTRRHWQNEMTLYLTNWQLNLRFVASRLFLLKDERWDVIQRNASELLTKDTMNCQGQ